MIEPHLIFSLKECVTKSITLKWYKVIQLGLISAQFVALHKSFILGGKTNEKKLSIQISNSQQIISYDQYVGL